VEGTRVVFNVGERDIHNDIAGKERTGRRLNSQSLPGKQTRLTKPWFSENPFT
jgi:hypothetical protein